MSLAHARGYEGDYVVEMVPIESWRGAVDDLREAMRLLDNARTDLNDPALKRSWARKRKALAAKWGQ